MSLSSTQFIHLRCHTEYSIKDSTVRIPDYIKSAKKDGMPALAISDLNNLFGAVKFYKEATKQGIKPIIACDIFLENEEDKNAPYQLLLLCKNKQGYLQLNRLLSKAYKENQPLNYAMIHSNWLMNTQGLILLSGALQGDIGRLLLENKWEKAFERASFWAKHFPDHFYLEVQKAGFPDEEYYLQQVVKLAQELDLPLVATHPIQFLSKEEFDAHTVRFCIAQGMNLDDTNRPEPYTHEQYFKTQAEMIANFAHLPSALQNSVEIAKRCNFSFELGKNYLPNFVPPENLSIKDFLQDQAKQGLERHLSTWNEKERQQKSTIYFDRLQEEIDIILKMGFGAYFLIVADFINWAKHNDVPVGPGRGSGAGSLTAYSLGITNLDPIKYGLIFERFLNPDRVSMPDFDIDFCPEGRDRVIQYVKKKYGEDAVSQIATFGTMAAKGVIRDVGRVLGLPYMAVDNIAKLIPQELGITLSTAIQKEEQLQKKQQENTEIARLFELALKLEGLVRNVGMHAGGVLISPSQISDFSPIYCQNDGSSLISQFDKDDIEAIGLVKFDFLGLRTLTILNDTLKVINKDKATSLTLENIPLDDVDTFELLKQGKTTAVFQLESAGMKDMIKKARPDHFEDIIALVALYRPGPMDLIPDFCRRKHGLQKIDFPHPDTQFILKETYGIIIYQEQVMKIAQVIGGYSLGAADLLRRAMGKKNPEEMTAQREVFVGGAKNKNIGEKKANEIFDLMEKFANYGFNKSHAAAYALLAYQTAYLKAHYPAHFMASVLSSDMNNTDNVHIFYKDALTQGLKVLPPDINQSYFKFYAVDEQTVLYGLGALKGSGESAIQDIMTARQQKEFTSIFDFCRRVDLRKVNKRVLEPLIRAGAFDSLHKNRRQLLDNIEYIVNIAEPSQQESLFGDLPQQEALPNTVPWTNQEQIKQEKEALGFYCTGHPYHDFKQELANLISTQLQDIKENENTQLFAGIVLSIRLRLTNRGKIALVLIDDTTAQQEILIGNELLKMSEDIIKTDQLLIIEGKVRYDNFSDSLRIQVQKIMSLETARQSHAQYLEVGVTEDLDIAKLPMLLKPYCVEHGCEVRVKYKQGTHFSSWILGREWRISLKEDILIQLKEWTKNTVHIYYKEMTNKNSGSN